MARVVGDDRVREARPSRVERETLVLDVAERLFYARGPRGVGMDELVRATGLGKMTVYRLFPSKDDLVAAYLGRKAATILGLIDGDIARHRDDPRAALLAIVDAIERDVTRAGFRGCPFNNAAISYEEPTHPARVAAAQYKAALHQRLTALADQLRPGGGAQLAAELHLVIDGMYLNAGLLGGAGPAAYGRDLAQRLIDAA